MTARLRESIEDRDKGFTLIELLVVIIIVGILAAIAIPIFLNQRKKGVEASMKADAKTLATQLETVYTDTLAYPAAIAAAGQTLTVGSEKVILSPNNVAAVHVSGDKFCISITNGAAAAAVYKSDAGGLQAPGATCAVATYGANIVA
jgi:type IV pilus assembly protein PilA